MSRARLVSLFVQSLAIASLLIFTSPTLSAQGIPWYTIPLPIPNGFVDASTGNLHLEITLGPHAPARDADPFVNKIVYDSNNASFSLDVNNYVGLAWNEMGGNSHSGTASYVGQSGSCPSGYPDGTVTNYSGFYFQDSNFTIHESSSINTQQVNCSTGPPSNIPYPGNPGTPSSGSGIATDGSGFSFSVTNYNKIQVYSPDGWLVYDSLDNSPVPMDPNGNYGSQPNTSLSVSGQYCPYLPPQPSPYTTTTTYTTSGGTQVSYSLTCKTLNTSSSTGVYSDFFLTGITLEDGTQYAFTYDTGTTGTHQGRLLGVTLPTGGIISINYVTGALPGLASQAVSSVAFAGGTWNLSYSWNSSTSQLTTTVISPTRYDSASKTNISDKTVFTSIPGGLGNQTAQYYAGSSTLLKTVSKTYSPYLLPLSVTTTLNDSGQSSTISYQYFENLRNYPSQKQETDFTGNVIRTTVYSYTPLDTVHPTQVNVYAGSNTSGTPLSSTLYTYDEYSANYCKNGVPMLTNVTGAYDHDDSGHGISWTGRGNATTTQRLISGTAYATSHACYDTLGNVTQTVDANGNPTSYSYTDNWVDSYCIPSGTVVHGYPTTVTDALAHQTKYSYYTCGVLKQSDADQNQINAGKSTTYTYDILNRPSITNYPDGGQTADTYSDTSSPAYSTESILMGTSSNGNTYYATKTLLDSYGRVSETQITSDPDCTSGDKADTTYDNFGRVLTVSNPYCTTSDPTYGLTTYSYDALARTTQGTHPDGTSVVTKYVGSATETTDEGNGTQSVQRISQTDGLGRLTSVCEVAPGPFVGSGGQSSSSLIGYGSSGTPASCGLLIAGTGFLATYQYDPLGNLLQVNQNGIGARTFSYDSLSRLVCASNPEDSSAACPTTAPSSYIPGTTGYTYDANDNLSTKTGPLQNQTTTASIVTSYQYDALNRLTSRSYNDSRTPTASFSYDSSTYYSPTNAVGRLVESYVPFPPTGTPTGQMATLNWYDAMGRVTEQYEYTPLVGQNGFPFPYAYDLMGNMTSKTLGFFNAISSVYNTAGRLTSFTSSGYEIPPPTNLLYNAHYNAAGRITSDTLGTGEVETYTYDKLLRLQAMGSTYNSTAIYSYALSFAPDGDVTSANDTVNGNWNYGYDAFNRLVCANLVSNGTCPTTGTPTYSYVYDRFGNRWQQNGPYTFSASFTGNGTTNSNRMDTYSYDAAGNLLYDGTHHYFYDAENHIIQVDGTLGACSNGIGTGTTACYYYDAQGQRVHRTGIGNDPCDSAGIGDFAYDLDGHWTTQVNNTGGGCNGEIYIGERHLASGGGGISFNHADWLGTSRLWNSVTYPIYNFATCTSLPFGDALTCAGGDPSYIHFTAEEHDFESNLDNFVARHYTSNMGRFMSPDPGNAGASPDDPQSWNAYAYVLNNPLINIDPFGLDCLYGNDVEGSEALGNGVWVLRGDCASESDNGLFVDGFVNSGSTTSNGDLTYTYNPATCPTGTICAGEGTQTGFGNWDWQDPSNPFLVEISKQLAPLNKLSDCTTKTALHQVPLVPNSWLDWVFGVPKEPEDKTAASQSIKAAEKVHGGLEKLSDPKWPARAVWGVQKIGLPAASEGLREGLNKAVAKVAPYASKIKGTGYALTAISVTYETASCYNKP
jgi:RHS repeat-associated protein